MTAALQNDVAMSTFVMFTTYTSRAAQQWEAYQQCHAAQVVGVHTDAKLHVSRVTCNFGFALADWCHLKLPEVHAHDLGK